MATNITKILDVGVAAQAASLSSYNLKAVKKPTAKKFVKTATVNLVGIPLLQAQSKIIGSIK